tara:strand:+ start:203 stop:346 length:144 start_codon:yes stop_codon:yes gene_type:complete
MRKISFEESLELTEDKQTPNPHKYFYMGGHLCENIYETDYLEDLDND